MIQNNSMVRKQKVIRLLSFLSVPPCASTYQRLIKYKLRALYAALQVHPSLPYLHEISAFYTALKGRELSRILCKPNNHVSVLKYQFALLRHTTPLILVLLLTSWGKEAAPTGIAFFPTPKYIARANTNNSVLAYLTLRWRG